jgi:precorrin isomerase
MFEIKSESDEIFISSATVADIELIDSVTATRLQSSGSIVSDVTTVNTGITSSGLSTTGGTNY